jgi:antitoxin ParD1/3/4
MTLSYQLKERQMRTSRPVTVTLGKQQSILEASLASGQYESASEVVRAALKALHREEHILTEIMREKIRASMADPRADVPAEGVFARLRERHVKTSAF